MRILTVDIGTGTQDIFLYDSRLDLENGFKLVVPSPTMIVHRQLREATHRRSAVLLTGVTMGGGPSQWAAEQHARSGFRIYATPEAARSFNDDILIVEQMDIKVISQDEALNLPGDVLHLELRDFDFYAISSALSHFGVRLDDIDAVAVGVFDHGNAPAGYSDRQFRFDYLARRLSENNRLSAFAYPSTGIPPEMTRLGAVARSAWETMHAIPEKAPLVVMDTAPAAILGATLDPEVRRRERKLIANIGNFHTLAFRLGPSGIEGVFEHHTGLLDLLKLEGLLLALADGSLSHQTVFDNHGHGALVYSPEPLAIVPEGETGRSDSGVVVTGPRRSLMAKSSLNPYFAVPYGDMMLTGCFGLLAATADVLPEFSAHIHASLQGGGGSGTPPWELD